jgi:hypothetical protein
MLTTGYSVQPKNKHVPLKSYSQLSCAQIGQEVASHTDMHICITHQLPIRQASKARRSNCGKPEGARPACRAAINEVTHSVGWCTWYNHDDIQGLHLIATVLCHMRHIHPLCTIVNANGISLLLQIFPLLWNCW